MKPACPERLSSLPVAPLFREVPAGKRPAANSAELDRHTPGEFDLPAGALWATQPNGPMQIHCARGQLWITQEGDARDIVLAEGEAFTPLRKGRVVVQALSAARLALR